MEEIKMSRERQRVFDFGSECMCILHFERLEFWNGWKRKRVTFREKERRQIYAC
jgi:hypothetical protein